MNRIFTLVSPRFRRFLGVGAANTAIDLSIYTVLVLIGVPLLAANFISTSFGLAFSFVANRRFTFQISRGVRVRDVAAFILITGAGLWLIQPAIILAFAEQAWLPGSSTFAVIVPKGAAIGFGVAWNWFWYRRVVFREGAAVVTAVPNQHDV